MSPESNTPTPFPGYPVFLFYAQEDNDTTWHMRKGLGLHRFLRWFNSTNEGNTIGRVQKYVQDLTGENPTLMFGSAVFAYGLTDTIKDVDLLVTPETIKKVAEAHSTEVEFKSSDNLKSLYLKLTLFGIEVEFLAAVTVVDHFNPGHPAIFEVKPQGDSRPGLCVIDPFQQLQIYKALNRDKDQTKIQALEKKLQPLVQLKQEKGDQLKPVDWTIFRTFERRVKSLPVIPEAPEKDLRVVVVVPDNYPLDILGKAMCLLLPQNNVHRTVIGSTEFLTQFASVCKYAKAQVMQVLYLDVPKKETPPFPGLKIQTIVPNEESFLCARSRRYGPMTVMLKTFQREKMVELEDLLGMERFAEDIDLRIMMSIASMEVAHEELDKAIDKLNLS